MIFEDYKIKEVSPEDSFLAELIEKTYWLGTNDGFVLGGLYGIIESVKRKGDTETETVKELEAFYNVIECAMNQYSDLHKFISEEWNRRGKPKSLKQQESEKLAADRRDEYKAEYCDR